MRTHHYNTIVTWDGNTGRGTEAYKAYKRDYTILSEGKTGIKGSSDPAFLGDRKKYNPEELLLASLSSCHMLWYLHLCAEAGVIVTEYTDSAKGIMAETAKGGHFTEVILYPKVTVAENRMIDKANELHKKANELCFIANSCNFRVHHIHFCKAENA